MAEVAKGGQLVPESVLKKQKRNEEWAVAKKQEAEALKKKNAANRKLIFNRAKQYSEEYEAQVWSYSYLILILFMSFNLKLIYFLISAKGIDSTETWG